MSGRAKTQVSIVINRKPDEVFSYLADIHKHAAWSPKAYRVEGIDGPVQLGSTFTSYGWVPKDADHRNTYVLTPQGNATRIDRTLDFPKPPGFTGAMFPLILGGFIKPATNKGMKMLKANLETGT